MSDFAEVKARMEKAGIQGSSAEWILKAISPATPSGVATQVPDLSSLSTATPEYVTSMTVSLTPAGNAPWDCLILKPPTYPTQCIAIAGPSPIDFAGSSWSAAGNLTFTLLTEPAGSALIEPFPVSSITAGSATVTTANTSVLLPSTQPLRWRTTARSSTEYLVASDLNNQGTVTSGQFPARVCDMNGGALWGIPPNSVAWRVAMVEIPLSENNMMQMNPKIRVAPAKQGVYQPLYCAGPQFDWATASPSPGVLTDWNVAASKTLYASTSFGIASASPQLIAPGMPTAMCFSDPAAGLGQTAWLSAQYAFPVAALCPYTWGLDNTNTGVSIYRGLAAGVGITVKMITALELVPGPESPIRQFSRVPPDHDPRALQLYQELVTDLPGSYPASANFLSGVLAAAKQALPYVLPHVAGAARSLIDYLSPPKAVVEDTRVDQPEMRQSATSRAVTLRTPMKGPRRAVSAHSQVSVRSARTVKMPKSLKKKKKNRARR